MVVLSCGFQEILKDKKKNRGEGIYPTYAQEITIMYDHAREEYISWKYKTVTV